MMVPGQGKVTHTSEDDREIRGTKGQQKNYKKQPTGSGTEEGRRESWG